MFPLTSISTLSIPAPVTASVAEPETYVFGKAKTETSSKLKLA